MKVGIMADSHDNMGKIAAAVQIFNAEGIELLIHCGDFIAPFTAREMGKLKCKAYGVFGNNDGEKLGLRSSYSGICEIQEEGFEVEIGGKRAIILHRDSTVDGLAQSGKYDLVIYGHTHKVDIRDVGKTKVINPGETGGWLTGRGTVVILDTETMEARVVNLP